MTKKIILWFITITLPFLLILVAEATLMLTGSFDPIPIFVPADEDGHFFTFNPAIARRYFSNDLIGVKGERDPFLVKKPSNGFRVFVQGESSVQGFPYGHSISFSRFLKQYLEQMLPDRNVEVVNTGLTAINSYVIHDIAREIPNYEPDAVIIYTGHNEYYGTFGPGSSHRYGGNEQFISAYLYMRRFRFFRALSSLLDVKDQFSPDEEKKKGTLEKAMVANEAIALDDEVYAKGLAQYEKNMGKALERYQENGIPVLFSPPLSNLSSQPPFVSQVITEPAWQDSLAKALDWQQKFGITGYPAYLDLLVALYSRFPDHAGINYLMGLNARNSGTALPYFIAARDLDQLRFRADSRLAEKTEELAETYGAHFSNAYETLRRADSTGIPGDRVFEEHVHFNIRGDVEMAFHFAQELANDFGFPQPEPMALAYHPMDSLLGEINTNSLKRNWPFTLHEALQAPPLPWSGEHPMLDYAISMQRGALPYAQACLLAMDYYAEEQNLVACWGISRALHDEYPELGLGLLSLALFEKALGLPPRRSLEALWNQANESRSSRVRKWAQNAGIAELLASL